MFREDIILDGCLVGLELYERQRRSRKGTTNQVGQTQASATATATATVTATATATVTAGRTIGFSCQLSEDFAIETATMDGREVCDGFVWWNSSFKQWWLRRKRKV